MTSLMMAFSWIMLFGLNKQHLVKLFFQVCAKNRFFIKGMICFHLRSHSLYSQTAIHFQSSTYRFILFPIMFHTLSYAFVRDRWMTEIAKLSLFLTPKSAVRLVDTIRHMIAGGTWVKLYYLKITHIYVSFRIKAWKVKFVYLKLLEK